MQAGEHSDLDGDDEVGDDLDEEVLERALDGAFAQSEEVEPGSGARHGIGDHMGEFSGISLRDPEPAGEAPFAAPVGSGGAHAAGKYVIQGRLGLGGVGVVHRGYDRDLGRDVAMKFLRSKFKDQPTVLNRFIEEAQIGGQLQHPGIVPVYELGTSKGRPFFAMKLVKGQTLAKRLGDRSSPEDDRPTFLSIFEDVCQTMAYAHARGVVHRDLKPANVMIGSFGEVQVVDWGMGKVLPPAGAADERHGRGDEDKRAVETVRSADGTKSVVGTVVGTPAYMPPEQARGDVDRMDERSDVFALGAILCEVLTGQPPYVGGDQSELLELAAAAELDDARDRLAACEADPGLVELAKRCLMPAPADRPRSAELVARSMHDYLAAAEARVHEARVAAARAEVRAAGLRRTQRLGIALTAVIALGLAGSLWFWRAAERSSEIAEANLANFNRLSYVVRLETIEAKEQQLYPAWPHNASALRAWLRGDAEELGSVLPELRETLATLRRRALPRTEAEQQEARRAHPRADELAGLRGKLAALRRAQAARVDPGRAQVFVLDEGKAPKSPRGVGELAWLLVNPEREIFGREAEGLALARRAVELAPAAGDQRASELDTLAWALHANGLDGAALEQSQAAVAAASEGERERFQGYLQSMKERVAAVSEDGGQAAIDELATRVAELEAEIDAGREYEFEDEADRFLYGTLRDLAAAIEAYVPAATQDVARRLAWAERVEALTITRYRDRWEEARRAIRSANGVTASERYAEVPIDLSPQMGLVPIGMNPQSKLWEFYHLRSGWDPDKESDPANVGIPSHRSDGSVRMQRRGIVFVLIPGGTFTMGAQGTDESAPNYDPEADPAEGPVHEVELAPYFLSKYEITKGQWARLSGGERPGHYALGQRYPGLPGAIRGDHPVEDVSWDRCGALLTQHGLVLPTEAEWERAARAGTSEPWFTGTTSDTLEGFANVRDQAAATQPNAWPNGESFDDGYKGPAPVGRYAPNGFGLYDILGNVAEWCRDRYRPGTYVLPTRPGDGLREVGSASNLRIERGGSARGVGTFARSAFRSRHPPDFHYAYLGLRPARKVTP